MRPVLIFYEENGQRLPGEMDLHTASCGEVILPSVGHVVHLPEMSFSGDEVTVYHDKLVRYAVVSVDWFPHTNRVEVHARPERPLERSRLRELVIDAVRHTHA